MYVQNYVEHKDKTVFQNKYSDRGIQNNMKEEDGHRELKTSPTLESYFIIFGNIKTIHLQHT